MKVCNIIFKIDNILGLNEENLTNERKGNVHNVLRTEAEAHSYEPDVKEPRFVSMRYYASVGHKEMNNRLRGIKDQSKSALPTTRMSVPKLISNFKELTKNKTNHSFIVHRGTSDKVFEKAKKGDIIQDKGFTSSSLSPQIARNFGVDNLGVKGRVFRIHVPENTKGFYVSGHPNMISRHEHEFVFHPGTKFRVGDTHKDENDNEYTDLHIHSQED